MITIQELKTILEKSNIEYIEDDLRILIDLTDVYTVESIVVKYNLNVLDEVTNHKEYDGDGKSYYLIAKPNVPIVQYKDIKTSHYIDCFNNRCIIDCEFPISVAYYGDRDNFDHHSHIRQCLPPNIKYKCECIVESDEIIIKLTNAILI